MLILAIETATRSGSLALARDGQLLEVSSGEPSRTHGERLPGDAQALLSRHNLTTRAIDSYAVSLGPGSFTGLRVGIATTQGLALAHQKKVVGISVIDTLVHIGSRMSANTRAPDFLVPWVDGKRSEVFSAIYERNSSAKSSAVTWRTKIGPIAATPETVLERWSPYLKNHISWFMGDGVPLYRSMLDVRIPTASKIIADIPPLAGEMAIMASSQHWLRQAVGPHALRPVYVRRPDAELARDRRRNLTSSTAE